MKRIPSPADVATLSRDEWEILCRGLAALIYQAEGVEDRRGKGNGLDMIRIDGTKANGWQFRRFDGRFGDKQAQKLMDAVRLAKKRCREEDGADLQKVSVWTNIDLEPGHGKKTGERERFANLKNKIRRELDVDVDFVGLSWIHAQLLKHPTLRPDLFEDVAGQMEQLRRAEPPDSPIAGRA
jgi:hypothetical protein